MEMSFKKPAEVTIAGKLKKVLFEKEDYKIALFNVRAADNLPDELVQKLGASKHHVITITAKGYNFPSKDGLNYMLYGTWYNDRQYGYGLNLTYVSIQKPENDASLVKFLSSSIFPGVGKKKAKTLVDAFHKDVFDVMEKQPSKIASLPGFDDMLVKNMQKAYADNRSYTELSEFLMPFGIKAGAIQKISKAYGEKAIRVVKHDPFVLLNSVKGIGFETCDQLANSLHIAMNSPLRISAVILNVIKRMCARDGGMYVEAHAMYENVAHMLNNGLSKDKYVTKLEIGAVYKKMMKDHEIIQRTITRTVNGKPEKVAGIFLKEYDDAERKVSDKLISLSDVATPFKLEEVNEVIDKYNGMQKFPLHPTQMEAVRNSIMSNCSIITGGPGTGKTTILRCIIYVWKALSHQPITCMAPTGKAARRMQESTECDTATIHRKLHLYQEDIEEASVKTIDQGLVVIDEMSMVDNLVMEKMMEALNLNCHLIMVGDTDQLPSVGVGAVLEQMIKSKAITYTRLTKTFRQDPANGGGIITNALKVNAGDSNLEYDDHFQLIEVKNEDEAVEAIKKIYTGEVKKWGIDNVALLAPLRSTQNGRHMCSSDGLNPVLQDLCNPKQKGVPSIKYGFTEFRLNDRVMKWTNGEFSSNGDIGVITSIIKDEDDEPSISIKWENGYTEKITKEQLEDITLAYSMSVHKSQGSEYNSVIIPVISAQECPLFKKNLLYTGITRSKKQIYLVGDKKAIHTMCSHSDTNQRATVLAARLALKAKQKHSA